MTERLHPGARFRQVLAEPGCATAVGAHDPTIAKLVEEAGFPVCYVSGSASSSCVGGFPDVGLLTLSELVANARHIINATELPVLCDADTGHGNVTNVRRTIREFESAGAAGVHLEDQTFPKRCGQTDGASCIPTAEMLAKIYAAKEAQRSDDFVVVVRTDARQCEGLDAVVERSRAYIAAGADAIFPEALLSAEEFRRARSEIDAPLVIDVPEWGRSPTMTIDELEHWGFDLGIFAVSTLRIALGSVRRFLAGLAEARTQTAWLDDMMTRAEMDDLLGLTEIRNDEERLVRLSERSAAGSTARS